MRFRGKIGVAICAAIVIWPVSAYAVVFTLVGAGTLTVNPTTQPPSTPSPVAPGPVYITGIPVAGGPVSHAPVSTNTDTDTHEGVTWGDPLSTDLIDLGRAKFGLKYYGATSGSGTTHGVGFSITIPE